MVPSLSTRRGWPTIMAVVVALRAMTEHDTHHEFAQRIHTKAASENDALWKRIGGERMDRFAEKKWCNIARYFNDEAADRPSLKDQVKTSAKKLKHVIPSSQGCLGPQHAWAYVKGIVMPPNRVTPAMQRAEERKQAASEVLGDDDGFEQRKVNSEPCADDPVARAFKRQGAKRNGEDSERI